MEGVLTLRRAARGPTIHRVPRPVPSSERLGFLPSKWGREGRLWSYWEVRISANGLWRDLAQDAKRCQDLSRCHGLHATLHQGWGHLSESPVIMRGSDRVPWRLTVLSGTQTAV